MVKRRSTPVSTLQRCAATDSRSATQPQLPPRLSSSVVAEPRLAAAPLLAGLRNLLTSSPATIACRCLHVPPPYPLLYPATESEKLQTAKGSGNAELTASFCQLFESAVRGRPGRSFDSAASPRSCSDQPFARAVAAVFYPHVRQFAPDLVTFQIRFSSQKKIPAPLLAAVFEQPRGTLCTF